MTKEEHAKAITDAIEAAEADGFETTIENECCGCSRMTLEVDDIVILGERCPA